MKNKFLQLLLLGNAKVFSIGVAMTVLLFSTGCDLNPLGGTKSNLGVDFEPGKHVQSQPPTISAFADYIIDENDTQTIPFTINDPDTFMVCSFIFVKATSSDNTIIDSTGLVVGGTYPNCTLQITPKTYKYGVTNIKVDLYDFWTHAVSNFQLTVAHILTPGIFSIVDAEGDDQAVLVTWQNAAYMSLSGAYTSPYYTLYYRPTGSAAAYTAFPRVTSPYNVTGLTNGVSYDFYVKARNSVGTRNSNIVSATPTKYKIRGPEFIAGSDQYQLTSGAAGSGTKIINSTLVGHIDTVDANYPALNYALSESPVNANLPQAVSKGSYLTSPSGKYRVYMNSQENILSGAQK